MLFPVTMIVNNSFKHFPESKYQNLQIVLFRHCSIGNHKMLPYPSQFLRIFLPTLTVNNSTHKRYIVGRVVTMIAIYSNAALPLLPGQASWEKLDWWRAKTKINVCFGQLTFWLHGREQRQCSAQI